MSKLRDPNTYQQEFGGWIKPGTVADSGGEMPVICEYNMVCSRDGILTNWTVHTCDSITTHEWRKRWVPVDSRTR